MLDQYGVTYHYRDYRKEPLAEDDLKRILELLAVGPKEVLRRRDRAFRELGLSGAENDAELIRLMAVHPTLLERPIGIAGDRAVVGRPPERLLDLAGIAGPES